MGLVGYSVFKLKMEMSPTYTHSSGSQINVAEEVVMLDCILESGLPAEKGAVVRCWARN